MATTVRITETYDLKTSIGKMGIIGIHTPSSRQLRELYPGLCKNHRFVRVMKCDVVGACASVLPADPLQVGVAAGDVAPEDMFNPILYKAVSNESFDSLVSRIYQAGNEVLTLGSVTKEDGPWDATASFKIYYSLLSENGRWKKAMPQRGFGMRGLVPICYSVINTFGNTIPTGQSYDVLDEDTTSTHDVPNLDEVDISNSDITDATRASIATTFRGRTVRMPRLPMHFEPEAVSDTPSFPIPKTFVGCIITPPARLHEFYYRMRVTWSLRFENVVPATAFAVGSAIANEGNHSYAKDYTFSSSKTDLEHEESSVDTDNVDINKIMES